MNSYKLVTSEHSFILINPDSKNIIISGYSSAIFTPAGKPRFYLEDNILHLRYGETSYNLGELLSQSAPLEEINRLWKISCDG